MKIKILNTSRLLLHVVVGYSMSGCASASLNEYFENEPVQNRLTSEMDFKSPEELNEIGQKPGAQ